MSGNIARRNTIDIIILNVFSAEFIYTITVESRFWGNTYRFFRQKQYPWMLWKDNQSNPFGLQLIAFILGGRIHRNPFHSFSVVYDLNTWQLSTKFMRISLLESLSILRSHAGHVKHGHSFLQRNLCTCLCTWSERSLCESICGYCDSEIKFYNLSNLSVTTPSIIKFITCDLFSNVF